MAKSADAQRESEGIIVVSMVAQNNATGARGPCGDQVDGAGKREGMTGKSGSNFPGGRKPIDKISVFGGLDQVLNGLVTLAPR